MPELKIKLLRPLDGLGAAGDTVTVDQADADRLAGCGAATIVGKAAAAAANKAEGNAPVNKAEGNAAANKAAGTAPRTRAPRTVGTDPAPRKR